MAIRPFTVDRALARVDDLYLNPDLTKAMVKALSLRCLDAGLFSESDHNETIRMSKDCDWCAEDVLSEVRSTLLSII